MVNMSNIFVKMVAEGKTVDTRAHFWCWLAWFILYDLKENIILVVEDIPRWTKIRFLLWKGVFRNIIISVACITLHSSELTSLPSWSKLPPSPLFPIVSSNIPIFQLFKLEAYLTSSFHFSPSFSSYNWLPILRFLLYK